MTGTHRGLERQIKFNSVFPILSLNLGDSQLSPLWRNSFHSLWGFGSNSAETKQPSAKKTKHPNTHTHKHTLRDPEKKNKKQKKEEEVKVTGEEGCSGPIRRTVLHQWETLTWALERGGGGWKVALSHCNSPFLEAEALTFLGIMTLQNEIIQQEM